MIFTIDASAKSITDNNISEISMQNEDVFIGCTHVYNATTVGCDGYKQTQNMGSFNGGDCEGKENGSVIVHNTTVDACDGPARDEFLLEFMELLFNVLPYI